MGRQAWTLPDLHRHLQGVVDLELWTIPYYLSVLYSIRNPADPAYRLVQSVVYQEMLHTQLAGNLANAYGLVPKFTAPVYGGETIPHIDFTLDTPNPVARYSPYSTELGPLDVERLNTLCLIEYPEWRTERTPDLRPRNCDYGSIGEFYDAVRFGCAELRDHCRGSVNQVDEFRHFYNDFDQPVIDRDGDAGFRQAMVLIDAIVDQGEGQTQGDADIPEQFQNTADGYRESWPHFRKFSWIRDLARLPETYDGDAEPPKGSDGHRAQEILVQDFARFMTVLDGLFCGRDTPEFGSLMAKLGGDVLSCWQQGAVPRFS